MKQLLSARVLRWMGFAITAVAVGLVVWSIYTSDLLASEAWKNPDVLADVISAAIIFLPSLFCMSLAWYLLIASVTEISISRLEGFYIYSVSAIYRYLPSNIGHYIGRYYMLHKRGVEHSVTTWGMVAETALAIIASTLVASTFGAPLIREALLGAAQDKAWLIVLAMLGTISVATVAVLVSRQRHAIHELARPFLRLKVLYAGLEAFMLHLVARIVSGIALWWLSSQILGADQVSMPDVIAIWAAAWVLGFVTPGASAGLGVREAVIIAALTGLGVPMSGATLVAIAFRVTTTIGDLVFSATGWASHRLIELNQASQ